MPYMKQLIEGYRRFRDKGWERERERWAELAEGQSPRIMVLACADSRVDPALIFDANPGEMFVVRKGAKRVLLVNESVEVQSYSTLTFGLLPGWWHATDAHDRLSGSPLADARTWTRLLHDEGFVDVTALIPGADETPALAAQQVLVARSDGELRGPASLAAAVTAVPAAALSATTPATAAIAIPVAIPTPGALPAAAPAAGAAAPGSPSPSADEPRLPASLAGRLRPLALSGATPRHLRLFADDAGHPWLFLNPPPANAFHAELLD